MVIYRKYRRRSAILAVMVIVRELLVASSTTTPSRTLSSTTEDNSELIHFSIVQIYDKCGCYSTECLISFAPELPGHDCTQVSRSNMQHAYTRVPGRKNTWMVTRCPQVAGQHLSETQKLCEAPDWNNLSTVTPVYADTTGFHYRNVFCAHCANAWGLTPWNLGVVGLEMGIVYPYWNDIEYYWADILESKGIHVFFKPPKTVDKVSTCKSEDDLLTSSCPGKREHGCSASSSMAPIYDGGAYYRNPHCFLCSGKVFYSWSPCGDALLTSALEIYGASIEVLINFNQAYKDMLRPIGHRQTTEEDVKLYHLMATQQVTVWGQGVGISTDLALRWYKDPVGSLLKSHLPINGVASMDEPTFNILLNTAFLSPNGRVQCIQITVLVMVVVKLQLETKTPFLLANLTIWNIATFGLEEEIGGLHYSKFTNIDVIECGGTNDTLSTALTISSTPYGRDDEYVSSDIGMVSCCLDHAVCNGLKFVPSDALVTRNL